MNLPRLKHPLRLFHTVRHLKPVQIYGRVWCRLVKPRPDLRPAPQRKAPTGAWVQVARRLPSLLSETEMRFLGEIHDIREVGWDCPKLPKLWRYNQHYFDDLNACEAADRIGWHRAIIARWIAECLPVRGTGWEPYPTSLRLVNWIKWLEAGNAPVAGMLDSMAIQTRHLAKRLEWHLLGNHLFANAKTLIMAGCFFEGPEADRWKSLGWRILRRQIPEQILADGGQFERTPMYHAIALEDMLDLLHMFARHEDNNAAGDVAIVANRIPGMLRFLHSMCHPDGEISFFNDAATGIAPSPRELDAYAARLDYQTPQSPGGHATYFEESGFARLAMGGTVLIADVGSVGPSYLPGHAHAGTLSFELSLHGHRFLVNSGVSEYGNSTERLRQRGTAAHNTVVIAGKDSSEVWSGFRVARRARVHGIAINGHTPETIVAGRLFRSLKATHDGYRRLKNGGSHSRVWCLSSETMLSVRDHVPCCYLTESFWHVAPSWRICRPVSDSSTVILGHGLRVEFSVSGGKLRVEKTTFHPSFGTIIPNECIIVCFATPSTTIRIRWAKITTNSGIAKERKTNW